MQYTTKVDLSKYNNVLNRKHQLIRLLWNVVWTVLVRPLPRGVGRSWKRLLLKCFGAKIHPTANVYSSAKVYYPANLIMEEYSCLANEVDCYNVALIKIGANTTVSQGAFLCTASHDTTNPRIPLITAPVILEDQVWVGANSFIGMGVTVGQGAVVGATASVYKNVEPWTIVGGNPAKFIKKRIVRE